jgi:hypothetical protein
MSKPDILVAIADKYGKKPWNCRQQLEKKPALVFCFLALRLLPLNSAVAAGNK